MPIIRPYRPSDRAAMYEICLKTADAGKDATGVLSDDSLWGDLFAVPYVEHHPDLAWIVEADDGRAIGYIVATEDTDAFYTWFRDEWWPGFHARYPRPAEARTPAVPERIRTRRPIRRTCISICSRRRRVRGSGAG